MSHIRWAPVGTGANSRAGAEQRAEHPGSAHAILPQPPTQGYQHVQHPYAVSRPGMGPGPDAQIVYAPQPAAPGAYVQLDGVAHVLDAVIRPLLGSLHQAEAAHLTEQLRAQEERINARFDALAARAQAAATRAEEVDTATRTRLDRIVGDTENWNRDHVEVLRGILTHMRSVGAAVGASGGAQKTVAARLAGVEHDLAELVERLNDPHASVEKHEMSTNTEPAHVAERIEASVQKDAPIVTKAYTNASIDPRTPSPGPSTPHSDASLHTALTPTGPRLPRLEQSTPFSAVHPSASTHACSSAVPHTPHHARPMFSTGVGTGIDQSTSGTLVLHSPLVPLHERFMVADGAPSPPPLKPAAWSAAGSAASDASDSRSVSRGSTPGITSDAGSQHTGEGEGEEGDATMVCSSPVVIGDEKKALGKGKTTDALADEDDSHVNGHTAASPSATPAHSTASPCGTERASPAPTIANLRLSVSASSPGLPVRSLCGASSGTGEDFFSATSSPALSSSTLRAAPALTSRQLPSPSPTPRPSSSGSSLRDIVDARLHTPVPRTGAGAGADTAVPPALPPQMEVPSSCSPVPFSDRDQKAGILLDVGALLELHDAVKIEKGAKEDADADDDALSELTELTESDTDTVIVERALRRDRSGMLAAGAGSASQAPRRKRKRVRVGPASVTTASLAKRVRVETAAVKHQHKGKGKKKVRAVAWPPQMVPNEEDEQFYKRFIQCDHCILWYHYGCVGVTPDDKRIENGALYICPPCRNAPRKGVNALLSSTDCGRPDCRALPANEQDDFIIERIIGMREFNLGGNVSLQWLIKWEGYLVEYATWESYPDGTLQPRLFDDFCQAAIAEGKDPAEGDVLLAEAEEGSGQWRDL